MDRVNEVSYNERLFSGGARRRLHMARFEWLHKTIVRQGLAADSVLELGCYDGKLIDELPQQPKRYLGLDANWEGGLDLARQRWAEQPAYEFRHCTTPDEMELSEERFDLVVAMETLEHVPPELIDGYLRNLAAATKGYFVATVPNEIGPLFAAKYLTKRVLGGDHGDYSAAEFFFASLGQSHKVARNEHKGFDYRVLRQQISRHFDLLECSGHPFAWLPTLLNFGIGFVGTPKRTPATISTQSATAAG